MLSVDCSSVAGDAVVALVVEVSAGCFDEAFGLGPSLDILDVLLESSIEINICLKLILNHEANIYSLMTVSLFIQTI